MATAANTKVISSKVVEEALKCYICYDLLREPKDLECPHVFCLECLRKLVKSKFISCPECRHITEVPPGGLAGLKTNLRLKYMIEGYDKSVDKNMDKDKCVPICPNHAGERQHFFCVTCGVTVCHNCLVKKHPEPQHEIKELTEIAKEQKTEMQTKAYHLQEMIKKIKLDEQILNEKKRKIESATQQAEKDIQKRVQEIVAEVTTQGNEMIASIREVCPRQTALIQEKLNHTKNELTRLKKLEMDTKNAIDTAADHEYVKQHSSLIGQMEEFCVTSSAETPHETPSQDIDSIRFYPGSCPMGIPVSSLFGHTVIYGNKMCRLKLITELNKKFKRAHAVATTLTGLLAVVDIEAEDVLIYGNVNGEYRHLSSSAETGKSNGSVTNPIAVATTSDGKLFISDYGVIKVFSSAGAYEKSWPKSAIGHRITSTPDDIIVTSVSNSKKSFVSVYWSNGDLVRTHEAGYKWIQGLASNGEQIAFTTYDPDKVCVIDFVTGQTLWTIDMVKPIGICYEHKSNTILVAGGSEYKRKCVIEQYCNTTGRLIARLASGLYTPCGMTVTHDDKLAVADIETVKIYSIQ